MDPLAAALALLLLAPPPAAGEPLDFDAPLNAMRIELDSRELEDRVLAAMAMPYKYGVTQMPCKAREWQPLRGWTPAREPAGRIQWVKGPVARVRWSGIYGTCFIESPVPRGHLGEVERTALECECNGWLPRALRDVPRP